MFSQAGMVPTPVSRLLIEEGAVAFTSVVIVIVILYWNLSNAFWYYRWWLGKVALLIGLVKVLCSASQFVQHRFFRSPYASVNIFISFIIEIDHEFDVQNGCNILVSVSKYTKLALLAFLYNSQSKLIKLEIVPNQADNFSNLFSKLSNKTMSIVPTLCLSKNSNSFSCLTQNLVEKRNHNNPFAK